VRFGLHVDVDSFFSDGFHRDILLSSWLMRGAGDCLLKYATGNVLFFQFPDLREGQMTDLRCVALALIRVCVCVCVCVCECLCVCVRALA
jgi:hypothetical protein